MVEVNVLLLGSVGFLLSMLTLIVVRIIKLHLDEKNSQARTRAVLEADTRLAQDEGRRQNRPLVVGGQRRAAARNRRNAANRTADDGPGFLDGGPVEGFSDEEDELRADELTAEDLGVDGKVGKKKLAKLQAKEEKKHMRAAEVQEREEKKRREKEKEERDKKDQEKMKADEEARKEQERIEREERERKEYEEYMMLKQSFAVEEEGYDQLEEEESQNLMRDFVEYVKTAKVVNMDELGAHFKMRTQDAIDRIKYFVDSGTLTGVIDDRGKFIYITADELHGVAKFINQRGRVSVAELADYSNQLIRLDGTAAPATQTVIDSPSS